jgi:hypothetical protein
MRKIVICGCVLVCIVAFSVLGTRSEEKVIPSPTPQEIHVVGITSATFPPTTASLDMSRACAAEFAGSRICAEVEAFRSLPPPPTWTGIAAAVPGFESIEFAFPRCYQSDGTLVGGCQFDISEPIRAICCNR